MNAINRATPVEGLEPEGGEEQALPIDIRTILIGLRRRVWLMLAFAVVSTLLGLFAGRTFGDRVYETSTVLLFKPPEGAGPESDGNEVPSLRTLVDLVELPSTYEEVRNRLRLDASVERIGGAIDVERPENSTLLIIKSQWNEAQVAADVANAVRDVFFERLRTVRRQKASAELKDLEARLASVLEQLEKADAALKQFTIEHKVVDLDKEAEWYLEQLINVEMTREQADAESQALRIQQNNIASIVGELKAKVASEERQANGADPATASGTELPAEGRTALLRSKAIDVERMRKLREDGLVSDAEYERAKADFEAERYAVYNNSPSAGLLKEMTLKELSIRLEGIAQQQKLTHLNEAVTRVSDRLQALPLVQREYVALARDVQVRAQERDRIEQFLALTRRQNESEAFDFTVVAPAKAPILPLRSNRKIVFSAIAALGSIAGIVLAVLLELGNRRARSLQQAALGVEAPGLAELPVGTLEQGTDRDALVLAAQRIRAMLPEKAARLLVASATDGEGASLVARHLGEVLVARGTRVLLVDARLQGKGSVDGPVETPTSWRRVVDRAVAWLGLGAAPPAARDGLTNAVPRMRAQAHGLGEYLRDAEVALSTVAHATGVHGLDLVPATGAHPSQLASPRMRALLADAGEHYDIVIVDTAPVLAFADANLLAENAHAALLVVQADRCTVGTLGKAVDRLKTAGAALIGCIVTEVRPEFLERTRA